MFGICVRISELLEQRPRLSGSQPFLSPYDSFCGQYATLNNIVRLPTGSHQRTLVGCAIFTCGAVLGVSPAKEHGWTGRQHFCQWPRVFPAISTVREANLITALTLWSMFANDDALWLWNTPQDNGVTSRGTSSCNGCHTAKLYRKWHTEKYEVYTRCAAVRMSCSFTEFRIG